MSKLSISAPAPRTALTQRIQARLESDDVSEHHREWGEMILSAIEEFAANAPHGGQVDKSKVVSAHQTEKDTLLIEWVFPECRLSYWIENDESESSWSFASSQRIDQNGYGGLRRLSSVGVGLALLKSVYA